KRTGGLASILNQLLRSSMQGQIHTGDTLGVWTFSDELHAGEFPLQTWSPQNQPSIANSVLSFIASQKLRGQPKFENVATAVDPLTKNSPFITVIIISSGVSAITGTPFDDEINKTVRGWRDEQEKSHMPFVIVVRAAHGSFADYK